MCIEENGGNFPPAPHRWATEQEMLQDCALKFANRYGWKCMSYWWLKGEEASSFANYLQINTVQQTTCPTDLTIETKAISLLWTT